MASKEMNTRDKSLGDFKTNLEKDIDNGWTPQRERWTDKNGIRYSGDRIIHATKKHHLTVEQLNDLQENITELYNASISNNKEKGQYGGIHILGRIDGKLATYRVTLDFMEDGTIWFDSAFCGKKNSIKKDIANHASRVLTEQATATFPPGQGICYIYSQYTESIRDCQEKYL